MPVGLVLANMYIDVDFHAQRAVKYLTESAATTEEVQADLSPWPFTMPHPPYQTMFFQPVSFCVSLSIRSLLHQPYHLPFLHD